MPRAFDRTTPTLDKSPLANLLDFSNIDQTAELAGSAIKGYVDSLLDTVVDVIKELTGIDLTNFVSLFEGIFDEIGLSLPDLAALDPVRFLTDLLGVFENVDMSSPEAFLDSLAVALGELLHLDMSSPEAFVDSIATAIGNTLGVDMSSPEAFFDSITATLSEMLGVDMSSPEAFFQSLADALSDMLNIDTSMFLGVDSPLNAQNLFNQVSSDLLGLLPVSQIGVGNPNLLANPGFDTAASLVDNPGWTWDGTDGHTHPGCAATTANGTLRSIVSNVVEVAQDQTLPVGAWVKYVGLTATPGTNALRVNVLAYLGPALVSTTMIAALVSPTGSSSAPADNGFVHLSGNFTVPAGVDNVVVQLQVMPSASAGTIKYDDAHCSKTGLLAQNLVTNLPTDLASLLAGVNARVVEIKALTNAVAGKAAAELNDITARLTGLTQGGLFDSTRLLGNVPIGKIPTDQLGLSNITDLQQLTDNITEYIFGGSQAGTNVGDARNALNTHWATTLSNAEKLEGLITDAEGAQNSGVSITVNFDDYPDSAQMPSGWVTSYAGAGSSTLGVQDGHTYWYLVNNGTRTAVTHHPTATLSDYQRVGCTVNLGPASNSDSWVIARCNAANDSYVFVRVVESGFLKYSAELGYVLNGVKNVWVPLTVLPTAADSRLFAGTGSSPRNFQFFCGSTLVFNYTEVGTSSALGAANRFFGIRGTTNGSARPSAATLLSVADSEPPTVAGSYCRIYRANTANVALPTGGGKWPNNTLDTIDAYSADYTPVLGTNSGVQVRDAGPYLVTIHAQKSQAATFELQAYALRVYVNNTIRSVGGAPSPLIEDSINNSAIQGNWRSLHHNDVVYCNAGDVIYPGYAGAAFGAMGDAAGLVTYMTITRLR